MLLFWANDGAAELWVGSHNWTKRALLGLNVEASLVLRLTMSSPLFAAAADYLARMKAVAEPFDVAKVAFCRYKGWADKTEHPGVSRRCRGVWPQGLERA